MTVVWVVRDRDADGRLLPFVTVWSKRPERVVCGRGAYWRGDDGALAGWIDSLWPLECAKRWRVVPESDLECIRIGR